MHITRNSYQRMAAAIKDAGLFPSGDEFWFISGPTQHADIVNHYILQGGSLGRTLSHSFNEITALVFGMSVADPTYAAKWFKTVTLPIIEQKTSWRKLYGDHGDYHNGALCGIVHFLMWLDKCRDPELSDISKSMPKEYCSSIKRECSRIFTVTLLATPEVNLSQTIRLARKCVGHREEIGNELAATLSQVLSTGIAITLPEHVYETIVQIIKPCWASDGDCPANNSHKIANWISKTLATRTQESVC